MNWTKPRNTLSAPVRHDPYGGRMAIPEGYPLTQTEQRLARIEVLLTQILEALRDQGDRDQ